jgi:hypothetical protein
VPRDRTTKGLAKRIELTYYERPHPFRRWWRVLCIALAAVSALWLVAMAAMGDQRIYTSGPVVTAHRMFETDCERCHVDRPKPPESPGARITLAAVPPQGWFFRRVSDGACLACHDGSIHHDTETIELRCPECHREHKVPNTLAEMSDRHCAVCHADLQTKSGKTEFERHVVSLAKHPEFAVFRKNLKDGTKIKLNHDTHLKGSLPSGGGKRRTLGCVDCHVEDTAGSYMLAINYDKHCKDCHPLEATADLIAPHQRPEIIRGFLLARLAGPRAGGAPAGQAPPAQPPAEEEPRGRRRAGSSGPSDPGFRLAGFHGPELPIQLVQRQRGGDEQPPAEEGRRRPGDAAPGAAPGAPAPGAGFAQVAKIEKDLFEGRTGCPYCHTVEKGEGLPTIVPPKIPLVWFRHATFNHRAHRPLTCEACHDKARTSTDTTDVLLPKLGSCQECHRQGGGARADCGECHIYHDRSKERSPDGPFTVPQFVTKGMPAPAPAADKKP